MFELDEISLQSQGAAITTAEIAQQPELWELTWGIYEQNRDRIGAFLDRVCANHSGRPHVVFTGAGTSAYVGDTVVPYLRRHGDARRFFFESIATTDIVPSPYNFLNPDDTVLLVSFARSGNSPESVAAVEHTRAVVPNSYFLNITCAPEGRLAQESADNPRALTLIIERANDKGFAMTGSYTCMELLAALIFDTASDDDKKRWVYEAARMGREVIAQESTIASWVASDFNRITYLGTSSFAGAAREGQLKILELTRGLIVTSFDSSMGYRHGPKSFVDDKTLVFVLVSNDPYARQYDLDILEELTNDGIALSQIAIQQARDIIEPLHEATCYQGASFTFGKEFEALPSAYSVLPFIMVAQTVALLTSLKVGNTPDTPSPTGTVNRVVKGVTIHALGK